MAELNATLWNPISQTRMVFTTPASHGDGMLLEVDWHVAPGHCLPQGEHIHGGPDGHIGEKFIVMTGQCEMMVDDKDITLDIGESASVPVNSLHSHPINTGSGILHVRQTITPDKPMMDMLIRVERYFETVAALGQQGKTDAEGNILSKRQSSLSASELLLPETWPASYPRGVLPAILALPVFLARASGMTAYVAPDWTLEPGH